jgi:hypothetical protein
MDGASTQAVRKSSKCVEEVLAQPLFFWFTTGHLVFWCIGALAASVTAAGSAASADAVDTATTNIVGR